VILPIRFPSPNTFRLPAEQEKFCGPTVNDTSTFVNGEMVIQALNESNTLLIPFVIDPFGALGPIAN
jgi:hypothetical protein